MGKQKLVLTCRGRTRTLAEWEKISRVPQKTIRERIKRDWPVEEAIFTPPMHRGGHLDSLNKIVQSCRGCCHYKSFFWVDRTQQWYCGYILDTHHKRPCPPGPGCTCYEKHRPTRGRKVKR